MSLQPPEAYRKIAAEFSNNPAKFYTDYILTNRRLLFGHILGTLWYVE